MELIYKMHIVFEKGDPAKWKNIKQTFIIKRNSLLLGFALLLPLSSLK